MRIGDKISCIIGSAKTPCTGVVYDVFNENGVEMVDLLIAHNHEVRHLRIEAGAIELCAVTDDYVEAIKYLLKAAGLDAANVANHKALETNKISLEQFQAAAKVLAREILKR